MPLLPHRCRCALLAFGSLLSPLLVARAQAGPNDSRARALLTAAVAAQTALPSLSATVTVQGTGSGPDLNQTLTLSFRKPQGARLAVADGSGPLAQFVSGGRTLTIYDVRNKIYRDYPLRPHAPTISVVFAQSSALLPRFLANPAAIFRMLAEPGVSVQLGTPSRIGGIPTDTVLLTLPVAEGPTTLLTFSLGQRDHLMRRLAQSQTGFVDGRMHTSLQTETLTRLIPKPALLASAFVFSPPPGVRHYTEYDPRLRPGAAPIPISAKDLSGRPVSLTQYRGKVLLLDFWATWCPPCVGEMPDIVAAYRKYHGRGFEVIGFSLDDNRAALTAFTRQNRMPWRQVFGGSRFESVIPRRYGLTAIPFSLLIGRDGKIRAVGVHGPELTAAIGRAMAKK